MKTIVYLADLRHNYGGVLATECMPLGVAYMKAVMDRDLADVESHLFAYPEHLLQAIKDQAPHIVMVTNYVWNEALGLHFAKLAKRMDPSILTVMGGPNVPVEAERQIEFLRDHSELDVYCLGEGDFVARDLVQRFNEVGRSLEAFCELEHESCIWRRPSGEVVGREALPRHRDIDEVPSPWLAGIMDPFFDGKLAPIIETNRGCPFSCSFCSEGTSHYNRINSFGLERLEAEIDYIGERINRESPQVGTLRIADSNFGMYERDVTISEYIGEAQKKYGWPTFIDATTGKNRADRIIRAMDNVNGALTLYQAVQSLDDRVLSIARRKNISLSTYEELGATIRGRGMRMTSDLILALPGETLDSHREGLRKLVNAGTDQMHCFQAMMLKGSDMESAEFRGKFKFDTRYRVLPKNYGEYGGVRVFDVEEIVVATETLPFEDYITARKLHVTFSVFFNDGWFGDVCDFAHACGIQRYDWLEAMLEAMEADDGEVRKSLLDRFVEETKSELFPSKETCAEFYSQDGNFEKLRTAEIGDNLMYKYRALGSFFLWPEVCDLAMGKTRLLLEDRGVAARVPDFDVFWADFHRFVHLKHAYGATPQEVLTPARDMMQYDFALWLADGTPTDTAPYRLDSPQLFEFSLTREDAAELAAAFEVWTSDIRGLSKMVTRVRIGVQERRCKLVAEAAPVRRTA
ncbi:MAG: radical SAM protein [bacterium]|nr:radical SAM protein [bacterium]